MCCQLRKAPLSSTLYLQFQSQDIDVYRTPLVPISESPYGPYRDDNSSLIYNLFIPSTILHWIDKPPHSLAHLDRVCYDDDLAEP